MKKTIKYLLLICIVSIVSCTGMYETYNTDPSGVTEEQLVADGKKLSAAMRGMQANIIPGQEHLYQYVEILIGAAYGGYLADALPWANSFAMYNPTADWLAKPMEIIVEVYLNYYKLLDLTDDPKIISIANITKVSAMSRLADIYGPIPFSEMKNDGRLTAAYDSQEDAYKAMIGELTVAINTLTEKRTEQVPVNLDNIYDGTFERWIKLANSLKLRLAMRLSYIDPVYAQPMAEEAVGHIIGVMSSNDDNAFLRTTLHPLMTIVGNWGDTRAAADIVSYMNGYSDPRLSQYFVASTFDEKKLVDGKPIQNGYHGLRIGIKTSSKVVGMQYSSLNIASVIKDGILVFNAAEVAFLRAEGALRGWSMGGDAKSLYDTGVQLSFEQWEAGDAASYLSDATLTPASYVDPLAIHSSPAMSTITVAYDDTKDLEVNLERIITQKWIANFPLGVEAWSERRRTGYPSLMPSPTNLSGGIITDGDLGARRLSYPQGEYTKNPENLANALIHLGGPDNMATNVWWDHKNKD